MDKPAWKPPTRWKPLDFKLYAETLEDLASMCGEQGEAAVAAVRWGSISQWLMRLPPEPSSNLLPVPVDKASAAVALVSTDDLIKLNYPHYTGKHPASPFAALPPERQVEARRIAGKVVAAWEAAGSPYVTPKACTMKHQYLLRCHAASADRKSPEAMH